MTIHFNKSEAKQKSKLFVYIVLIGSGSLATSCQSDAERNKQILDAALQTNQSLSSSAANDSVQLPIQTSTYTEPVKKVPTQEELIATHKVKSVKQTYEDGWSIVKYDKKGNKISEESDYSGKKTYAYEFDKNGKVTLEKTKYKDGSVFVARYEYNGDGKVITKTFTDSDGKTSVTKIEYNKKLNTRTEFSANGSDKEFYDNRGLRVRFESYDEKNKLMGYGEAEYNKDGLKILENASIMGMNSKDECEYNNIGQLLKQHRTGILDVYFMFEYNEKGLITTHKTLKGTVEEKTIYEYTYY